jgi:uncharacterized membrane protein YphA (DoxX/SURF4 family)
MTTTNTIDPDSNATRPGKRSRCYSALIVRILMGLMFTVFGLNGFLNFIPQPKTPMPEGAMAFSTALMKTGYMMPLVMGTQLLAGVLLLLNVFVPLALALIAPIIVGIITFHLFLAPSTIAPGIVVLVMELYLAWAYRNSFRPMLVMRATCGVK